MPYISRSTKQGVASISWFLDEKDTSSPVENAYIKLLINGQETFEALYDQIEKAKKSIDIMIWGFQPSMFFKRDGKALCIGDLLIKKVLDNDVEVKILVWSQAFHMQTFKEPNLGYMPGLMRPIQKTSVPGVLPVQEDYDNLWYKAIAGYTLPNSYTPGDKKGASIYQEAYERLVKFATSKSEKRTLLQYKNRSVKFQNDEYLDDLSIATKTILFWFASHHQKAVLIDYEDPQNAVGFVLEHNMIDCYWDNSEHALYKGSKGEDIELQLPNQGRNVEIPWQDVSSMLTGKVLTAINQNFCEAWNRPNNSSYALRFHLDMPESARKDNIKAYKQILKRESIEPPAINNKSQGILAKTQLLRTYDKPNLEEIKKMYLQNITKVSRYIYTENQYFRFPPLVDKFIAHWQNLKAKGRNDLMPIYWFVVTNSSDEGVESGAENTYRMLKKLGRQEAMPQVEKKIDGDIPNSEIYGKTIDQEIARQEQALEQQEAQLHLKFIKKEIKDLEELEQIKQKLAWLKQQKQQIQQAQTEDTYQKFAETIGIKSLICTLVADEKDNFNPPRWQEVYVHSKITIIDDIFMFLGSANLNTRSMQKDTEMGIITECQELALGLRKTLWGLHTKNDPEANPEQPLITFQQLEDVYNRWEKLMDSNLKEKRAGRKPRQPVTKFLRQSATIGKLD